MQDEEGAEEVSHRRCQPQLVGVVGASLLVLVLVAVAAAVLAVSLSQDHFAPAGRFSKWAVAADAPLCARHGEALLARGGGAADAAVAVLLCLGVVHPQSSGIGGGAVFLWRTNDGAYTALDARETAPARANVTMFRNVSSERGPLAVAVPGELAGMMELHRRFGKLPWKDCVTQAMQLCNDGFLVDPELYAAYEEARNVDGLSADSPLGQMLAGLRPGGRLKRPALATTLQRIADDPESFYNGSLARDLVSQTGGVLTEEDFRNYRVREVGLVETFFLGHRIVSVGAEFGGSLLVQVLNTVEAYNFPLLGYGAQAMHYLVEAFKFAYANRLTLGDPAFEPQVPNIIAEMTNKQHAANLRARISSDRTFPLAHYADLGNLTGPSRSAGTTHACIVDSYGMAISVTSTVNLYFGSFVMAAGVIMNDEMDDFSSPDRSNSFGYPPSVPNFIAPGKRPLSSMTPTMVETDGRLRLLLGGSGGSRIITGVVQVLLQALCFTRSLADAVGLPRLHEQLLPVGVNVEARFGTAEQSQLAAMGHVMVRRGPAYADAVVQAIRLDSDDSIHAACDWRKEDDPRTTCQTAGQ